MIKSKPTLCFLLKPLGLLVLGIILVSCFGSDHSIDHPADQVISEPTTLKATSEISSEMTPASDSYTVSGIPPGESIDFYQEPLSSSDILGQIPSFGRELRPVSNIQLLDGFNWMQIQYLGQTGWIDFSYLAEQNGDLPDELVLLGQLVLISLKNFQYDQLEDIIHPDLCLRFSPYSYLNADSQIICGSEIAAASLSTEKELFWGHYDGTGNPINLTFDAYHQKFIYDQDYLHSAIIGFNQEVSSGNSINNIPDLYPDGKMIEYHFPGIDPQYGGLDWRSIRLVFVQLGSDWYLVSIIHGEWTI